MPLTAEERAEAEGLVNLAEPHPLRLRAERGGGVSDIPRELLVDEVILRARGRCEYCHLSQLGQEATFHIDHVTPRAAAGPTTSENLALACVSCSLRKWAKQTAVDPLTGKDAPLFHPRTDAWGEHFRWNGSDLGAPHIDWAGDDCLARHEPPDDRCDPSRRDGAGTPPARLNLAPREDAPTCRPTAARGRCRYNPRQDLTRQFSVKRNSGLPEETSMRRPSPRRRVNGCFLGLSLVITLFWLSTASVSAQSAAPAPPKLDATLVEAWKRAGAQVGWYTELSSDIWPTYEKKPANMAALPAFTWPSGAKFEVGLIAELPAPEVPFAVILRDTQITDAVLKEFGGFKNLHTLHLYGTKVTDVGLEGLIDLKNLRNLDLSFTKITDAGLKHLATLNRLQNLSLHYTKVTDAGLKELAALKNVRNLNLNGTKVTDAGLKELAAFTSLQQLHLVEAPITGTGLRELTGLKNLQSLNLQMTQLSDAGLKEVAALKSLRQLLVGYNGVTDTGLKELATLERLQVLYVGHTKLTDAGLIQLAGLTSLQDLHLSMTPVTDAGLKAIAGFTRLQHLNLQGTKITDAGLKHLAGLQRLQSLSLDQTPVADAGLKHLAGLTNMQNLSLSTTVVTDVGLKELAGLRCLEILNLTATKVSDAGLPELSDLSKLRALYLTDTKVTDAGAAGFRKGTVVR